MSEIIRTVEEKGLAKVMKSGSLAVLATPQMIAWMEEAACLEAAPLLTEGQTTVGIRMDASHDAPSPLGASIRITANLTGQKKRILFFETAAYMNETCIGKGSHTRCIVDAKAFMEKLEKLEK